jgi:lipopolysaccharide transport system ATP-binding protein
MRRDRLIEAVRPEEFASPDVLRFRLTDSPQGMKGQHYVRRATVAFEGDAHLAPLELVDLEESENGIALDVLGSEWGRQHNRRGSECRSLAPSSATFRGGHILVRRPAQVERSAVTVEVESEGGLGEVGPLGVQYIDLSEGEWKDLPQLEAERLADGWTRGRFSTEIRFVSHQVQRETLQRLIESDRRDAEIVGTALIVDGRPVTSIREHQPFEVAVAFRANRPVQALDVGIRFIRSDGVYVFWQSSGAVGWNLYDIEGEHTAGFMFDPNVCGPGSSENRRGRGVVARARSDVGWCDDRSARKEAVPRGESLAWHRRHTYNGASCASRRRNAARSSD